MDVSTRSFGPWWAWIVGGAMIVAAMVAAVLIATHQSGPSAAAEDWANAYLDGDEERVAELGCDKMNQEGGGLAYEGLQGGMPRHIDAAREDSDGNGGWDVKLEWNDAFGQVRTMTVNVTERDGRFTVC